MSYLEKTETGINTKLSPIIIEITETVTKCLEERKMKLEKSVIIIDVLIKLTKNPG